MAVKKTGNLQTIFTRLLVFKLLLPTILIALILFGSSAYYNAVTIQHDQQLLAQYLMHTIDDYLTDTRQVISGLAPIALSPSLEDIYHHLSTAYTSDPYFHSFIILDEQKRVRVFYPPEAYPSTAFINRIPIFDESSENSIAVSQPYFSTLPGKPTAYLSTRVEGQGWLVGELKFDFIENVVKSRPSPLAGREVILVDKNDNIITSSLSNSIKPNQKESSTTLLARSLDSSSLVIFQNNLAFFTASDFTQSGWQIKVLYPLQYAFGGYLITTSVFLGIILAIWLMVLLNINSEFKKQIYHPLMQFSQYINSISGSQTSERTRPIRIPAPFSEINDLSESFDHMSKTISSRQQALIENEQKYRVLIEQSGDAIYLEQNGEFVVINQKFTELFGEIKPAEKMSSGIHCLAASSSTVFVQEQQLRMLSGEVTNLRFEFVALDKNQQEIDVEVATSVFLYRNQMAIQGVIRDITQRKRAERAEKEQRALAEALRDTASALTSTLNLDEVMERILNNTGNVVPCEALNIMLIYGEPKEARIVASKGYTGRGMDAWLSKITFPLEKTPNLSWMYKTGKPMVLPNVLTDERWSPLEESRWIASYASAPIKVQGQVIGFLNLDSPEANFFSVDQADRLQAFADQAGIAIHNAQLLRDLSQSHKELTDAYETTLQGWSRALELRDYETQGHTLRVEELTTRLARKLGMTEPELTHLRYGVLLHDIGKICIPDQILFKRGPLTSHEWEIMREHPKYAYQMLSPIQYLNKSLDVPYCHHEWWNGAGYPQGLKGEEIPLAARIFSVVDVWDALVSDRPYHDGLPGPQVIQHLRNQAGKQLDPDIVHAFIEMITGTAPDPEN